MDGHLALSLRHHNNQVADLNNEERRATFKKRGKANVFNVLQGRLLLLRKREKARDGIIEIRSKEPMFIRNDGRRKQHTLTE